ncbi:MAG: ECF-type sigma factor [Phycisphaerales bacterium]|nr:sigma-70 family RNA polymerase sigma factor [Phycisphaerales bacterium]
MQQPTVNQDIFRAIESFLGGDESVARTLLPHVYNELRHIARGMLGGTINGTVCPTVLVHEAFAKLSGRSDLSFASPAAFYSFTARVMRSVLVDHARSANAQRRGGGINKDHTVSGLAALNLTDAHTILSLNEALDELAQLSDRKARVVELRFFAGLEEQQIADMLDVSRTTVSSDWRFARAWLLKKMQST